MGTKLTIARFQERTEALGPGVRAVVWFHGCSLDCPDCIAKAMNHVSVYETFSPQHLASRILAVEGIEGITLSGGEPFEQDLAALAEFLEIIRSTRNYSVMCYTGRTLGQLRQGENCEIHERILGMIDILVDGPYIEAKNDGFVWRGSSNQVIHFLSPKYAHLKACVAENRERKVEVVLGADHRLDITGIPPKGFMEALRDRLAESGLVMDFTGNRELERKQL